jgi:hypothetical protein
MDIVVMPLVLQFVPNALLVSTPNKEILHVRPVSLDIIRPTLEKLNANDAPLVNTLLKQVCLDVLRVRLVSTKPTWLLVLVSLVLLDM